jgi:Beta-propeller repeat/Abnormal spindle-like microcephaly-assoc'd, ASPM-SPD-2-Hydin
MRSKFQSLRVGVYSATVCAAAVLMATFILWLPLGRHRLEGKISQQRNATATHGADRAAADKAEPAVRARAVESYGKLPLSFEANQGQTDRQVKFLSRGSGYSLFLTGNEAVLALRKGSRRSKVEGRTGAGIGSADLALRSAAFPGLLPSPAPELETNSRTADPRTGSALRGLLGSSFQFPASNFQTPATNNEPRTTGALLRMKLVRANPNPKIVGMDELPGKSNYFIGNDPKKWRTNVPNYAKVKYANVYPGVDLVYYGNQGQLEYDFVVSPGADPAAITLELATGQSKIQNRKSKIDKSGDLVVGTDGGEVIFHKPVVYQPAMSNAQRTKNQEPTTKNQEPRTTNKELVEGKYIVKGNHINFEVANYDKTKALVIDPVLAYSTYLQGSGSDQQGHGIVVDASGNAYVTGSTDSPDFPTTAGAFQTKNRGTLDAFVIKLNAAGSAPLYATYLGGGGLDSGAAVAVDASGNAYITGYTSSPNFPTTAGAFQTTYHRGGGDAFVTKLEATGSVLIYSTYLGGSGRENFGNYTGGAIAVDASGNAYVAGTTTSSDFPTTPGAFQTTYGGGISDCSVCGDAFVSKLNSAGSSLLYSTYLGGSGSEQGYGIAVDGGGNAYVTGATGSSNFPITPGAFQTSKHGNGPAANAFVTKLNAFGSALLYSTYLGGSGGDSSIGIAVDASGQAYVTGATGSSDFPTTPSAFQTTFGGGNGDAFVTKLNAAGSALLYSTYVGGGLQDGAFAIAIDTMGKAYVTGWTQGDFPITPDALQTSVGNPPTFICKLNPNGSGLLYSTYFGGSGGQVGQGMAVDALGNTFLTGSTFGYGPSHPADFPTTPAAFQVTLNEMNDAFVAKISPADAPGLALGPGGLIFGPQAVGSTSDLQTVVLLAAGSQPLTISSIVDSGDFAQGNSCVRTLPAGTTCAIGVNFTPTVTGTRSGAVTITDNAAGSPHKLLLTGTGGVPVVSLTPASLTFAPQAVGTTSPAQRATLKNTGDGSLSITSIVASGDFAQTNSCGKTLEAGAACTLRATFTPRVPGSRTGAVTITDDGPGSPHQLALTGTGTGGQPAVTLAPASVPFLVLRTVGTSSLPHTVKLTNVGSAQLDITGITLTGPDPGDFAQSNNCPPSVASGATCVITATFTPTAQGVRTASISIADNAPGSPQTVPLTGRGTFLQWAPRALNMGNQRVGTSSAARTVTLTNVGTAPIALFSIQVGGVNAGDFTQTNTCGSSLNAGGSCTIQVTFTPTATGDRLGHVAIQDNAFGGTHWVGLFGTGK